MNSHRVLPALLLPGDPAIPAARRPLSPLPPALTKAPIQALRTKRPIHSFPLGLPSSAAPEPHHWRRLLSINALIPPTRSPGPLAPRHWCILLSIMALIPPTRSPGPFSPRHWSHLLSINSRVPPTRAPGPPRAPPGLFPRWAPIATSDWLRLFGPLLLIGECRPSPCGRGWDRPERALIGPYDARRAELSLWPRPFVLPRPKASGRAASSVSARGTRCPAGGDGAGQRLSGRRSPASGLQGRRLGGRGGRPGRARGRGDSPWSPRGRERGAVYTCSGPPSYSVAPREIGASWLQALGVLGRVGKLRLLPGTLGALRPESSPSPVHMTAAADGQRGVGCDWQGPEGTGEGDFFGGKWGFGSGSRPETLWGCYYSKAQCSGIEPSASRLQIFGPHLTSLHPSSCPQRPV